RSADRQSSVISGVSYRNDTSQPLRDIPPVAYGFRPGGEHEGPANPKIPFHHVDQPDAAVQDPAISRKALASPSIPSPLLNFDGIPFPGVSCNCAPPDADGEVGLTQFVQIVNEGIQVFDKTTGTSVLGPIGISSIWSGFGGLCETGGQGDPIILFDQLAGRWV